MKKKQLAGDALLLCAALIWGAAFTAQAMGMDYVGPLTFNGTRGLLAAAVLLPVRALVRRHVPASAPTQPRILLIGGLLCGLALFCASTLQQVALQWVPAGKAGFFTTLYIVLVPLVGVLIGKKVPAAVWPAVALAAFGLYLLCGGGSFTLSLGEVCLLGCALCYAVQILLVDWVGDRVDPMLLCAAQFLVSGVLSLPAMFVFEHPSFSGLAAAAVPLLYTAVLSGAVGYTLQIMGQRSTGPAVASLLMSFESVFSALVGWLVLGERLSGAELTGCALVFAAVLISQAPPLRRRQAAAKKAQP